MRKAPPRKAPLVAVMCGLSALSIAPAAAQDAGAGRSLADKWCAACHVVAPDSGDSDAVPSFERIAEERQPTEQWLTLWVTRPHHSMPSLSLTRQEVADIVAYFDSLRGAN